MVTMEKNHTENLMRSTTRTNCIYTTDINGMLQHQRNSKSHHMYVCTLCEPSGKQQTVKHTVTYIHIHTCHFLGLFHTFVNFVAFMMNERKILCISFFRVVLVLVFLLYFWRDFYRLHKLTQCIDCINV